MATRQLTKEEAIAIFDGEVWKTWSDAKIARFQMEQECLCIPFGRFHEAVEKTLGRPVFTHEFGLNHDGLAQELAGTGTAPTLDEIMSLLPAEKTIVVVMPDTTNGGE